MFHYLKYRGSYRLATHISMAVIFGLMAGPIGFLFGLLAYGGSPSRKEGEGGVQFQAPPVPVYQDTTPKVDDAQVQADIEAINRRRAAAVGLGATDVTKGALAGDPTSLNTRKPTLLGGGN